MTESTDANLPDFSDSDHAGVSHRIIGSTMPVLEVQLQAGQTVIAQGGELSWMSPNVSMATSAGAGGGGGLGGILKRAVGGATIFMTEFTASSNGGTVAFAAKMPGHIKAISVDASHEWMVSRHGFLAATPDVTLNPSFQQNLGVGIFSGNGFVMQRIAGQGTAWIELSGELITYDLAAGETLLVHPGHVGLFEASVNLAITQVKGIKNILFGSDTLFLAQLTGPGKVYLQTLTLPGLAHALTPYLPQPSSNGGGGFQIRLGQ
jgi:uncharacterized protein (TIGR00266 family)